MRFRRLTLEELEGLETEFVRFLIVNGIDAPAWQAMKSSQPAQADGVIDLFSDFIFEGITGKITYMEQFGGNVLRLFHCQENVISLISIEGERHFHSAEELLQAIKVNTEQFQLKRASKAFVPDRAAEIFRMLESGATVRTSADVKWWFDVVSEI